MAPPKLAISLALPNAEIPIELQEEILVRCPAKVILKFKTVSRSWNELISSRRFIERHLECIPERAAEKTLLIRSFDAAAHTIASNIIPRFNHLRDFTADAAANDDGMVRFTFLCPIASVDGIVLFNYGDHLDVFQNHKLIIWNPTLGQSYMLPPLFGFPEGLQLFSCVFGLGFAQGLFVAALFDFTEHEDVAYTRQFHLYSRSTNNWQVIDVSVVYGARLPVGKVAVIGRCVLHWLFYIPGIMDFQILTFDLSSFAWGTISLPVIPPLQREDVIGLGALADELCLLTAVNSTREFYFFTLRDDGDRDRRQWIPTFSTADLSTVGTLKLPPLLLSDCGKEFLVLRDVDSLFAWYRPESRSVRLEELTHDDDDVLVCKSTMIPLSI